MPAALGETETATVGVTGVVVVGAVSAVYYKIPSLPFAPGVRCPSGLHTELFCSTLKLRYFHLKCELQGLPSRSVTSRQLSHTYVKACAF